MAPSSKLTLEAGLRFSEIVFPTTNTPFPSGLILMGIHFRRTYSAVRKAHPRRNRARIRICTGSDGKLPNHKIGGEKITNSNPARNHCQSGVLVSAPHKHRAPEGPV